MGEDVIGAKSFPAAGPAQSGMVHEEMEEHT